MNLSISLKNLELNIGPRKITIKDRFTLILGKFKSDFIEEYQNQEFLQIIAKVDLIPAKNLIDYFQNRSGKLKEIEGSLKILEYLTRYRKIVDYNLEVFTKINEIIEIILLTFRYAYLSERKNQLVKELELAKEHKKSSELSAIVDLINKLKESIKTNQNKLNYIKEDFFQRKNQIDQIKDNLSLLDDNIQELNQFKKSCFSQINKITRHIEGATNKQENDSLLKFGIKDNLTNSEMIRALQKKAKETQYEINKIKSRSKQVKEELEGLIPHYDIYKNDYEDILNSIKEDEKRLISLQIEYEKEISGNDETRFKDLKDLLKSPVRLSREIEKEISRNNSELEAISIPDKSFSADNPINLKISIEKLKEIDNLLISSDENLSIRRNEKEISQIFDKYNLFESSVKDLEGILNNFLKEINIEMKFLLVINDTNTSFFLKTNFIRNNKDKVSFEELTTPEKIFFVVSLFISTGVLLEYDNIFFSNLFIPRIYNKGGSIYRTIRKILPLFETDNKLTEHKLIFFMSNLELKNEINNLKLIKL